MTNTSTIKNLYLSKIIFIEIPILFLTILGYLLKEVQIKVGNPLFILGLILLTVIYIINAQLKAPKQTKEGPHELGYRAFTIKMIYFGLALNMLSILWVEGLQSTELVIFFLTAGITMFIIFIPYAIFYLIRYRKGKNLNLFDYLRYIIASIIILMMYINRGIKPPFFD